MKYLNEAIKSETVYARTDENPGAGCAEPVFKNTLDEKIKNSFFRQLNNTILIYLQHSVNCLATNLLLYEKLKNLPLHYMNAIKNKQDWGRNLKPFDIINYTKQLKKKTPIISNLLLWVFKYWGYTLIASIAKFYGLDSEEFIIHADKTTFKKLFSGITTHKKAR